MRIPPLLRSLLFGYWRLKTWVRSARHPGEPPLSPLRVRLAEARVALITTAGVHGRNQTPFDCERGDWTERLIRDDVKADELMITHTHYDTSDAEADLDCVFPLRTLRTLAAEGLVGSVSPVHFGLMGYIPQWEQLVRRTAPAMARTLRQAGVDAVVLSPG